MNKISWYVLMLTLITSQGFAGTDTPIKQSETNLANQTSHISRHSNNNDGYIHLVKGQHCMISENNIQVKCTPHQ